MLRNPGLRKSVEQPVLDLNFAASQIGSNAAPDSRIDFSRGSNAWFVDSDGLVKKSPHNLSLYSEDFTQWAASAGVVTANQIAAPDGSLTADLLADDGTTGNHRFSRLIGANTIGETMFASIYVKATSDNTTILWREDKEDALSFGFNPTTGQITSGTGTAEDVGNGWYRLTITGALASQTVWSPEIRFSGTPASVYVWGAQVSQHTTLPVDNPYIKTEASAVYAARLDHDPTWFKSAAQEQNLLLYSEVLADTTYWTFVRLTGNSNTSDTTAPDGTNTAERFLETGANNTHYFQNDIDVAPYITKGQNYTYSAYVKRVAGSDDRNINIELFTTNDAFTPYSVVRFDLDSVSSSASTGSPDGHSITDEGDGWFRISVTEAANKTTRPAIALVFTDGTNRVYAGSTSKGFYIWGIQLEVGTSPGTYHRTEGAPYYGPGATPKGLLIEEQRTNLVTQSEDFGTTWTTSTVTVDTDEVLAPDGATSADFLEETTATSVHEISMASLVTDATSKHVLSCFVKAQDRTIFRIAGAGYSAWATGGTWPNAFFDLSTETVTLSSGHSAGMEDYGNGWYRCHVVGTSGSSPTGAGMTINVIKTGTTTSYTGEAGKGLYVWGAQLEKGDFLTSYMQTTGTSLTRNADVATMGPTTGGTELVTNGTFDTDATGWSNLSGRSSLSVSSGQLIVDVVDATVGFVASVSVSNVVPGRRYRLSADLAVNSGTGVRLSVYHSSTGIASTDVVTGSTLTTVTKDFTAPSGATGLQIYVDNRSPQATTDELVVDNVSLRELYPFEQYNPAELTLITDHDLQAGITQVIWGAVDADGSSFDNTFYITASALSVRNSGVSTSPLSWTALSSGKIAASFKEDNVNFARSGVAGSGDTSTAIPPIDKFAIGHSPWSPGNYANGTIRRFAFYNRRLPDETLEALTND